MATTMFFEKTLTDKEANDVSIEMEFGRSSYYGESLIYLTIDGSSLILDEKAGRELCEAFSSLSAYLGYDKPA